MSTPLPRFVQTAPAGQCKLRCRMCPIQCHRGGADGKRAFMQRFRERLASPEPPAVCAGCALYNGTF